MKAFREDISKTLNNIETKVKTYPNTKESTTESISIEWQSELKRLGKHKFLVSLSQTRSNGKISFHPFSIECEVEKLKFQSSDDINDCVKYISAINDKLNQVEHLQHNQHNYTEYVELKAFVVT